MRDRTQGKRKKTAEKKREAKKSLQSTMTPDQNQGEKLKEDTKKAASFVDKAGTSLDIERHCWQLDTWMLDETEESKPLVEDPTDKQMDKDKTSILQATEGFEQTAQDMHQEEKEPEKRTQTSHQVQLEGNRNETRSKKTAEKKREAKKSLQSTMTPDQNLGEKLKEDTKKTASFVDKAGTSLDIERHCWQLDTWMLDETEESKPLVEDQTDKQMDKEKSSIPQATEGFEQTAQDMHQEEKEPEKIPQTSHQVQLEGNRNETRRNKTAGKKREAKKSLQSTMTPDQNLGEKLKEDTKKTASFVDKAGTSLDIERHCWQLDTWMLDETEESKPLVEDQTDKQMDKEKTSIPQATEGFEQTAQDMHQEEKEPEKRPQTSHQVQFEGNRNETRRLAAALKKAEDLLETERLCWQREKVSLLDDHSEETRKFASAVKRAEDLLETEHLSWQREKISLMEEMAKSTALYEAQLDEQKCEKKALAAALRNVEQKLESHQVEWQQEKTSIIQATEDLKKTVHDTQKEAKEAVERSQASHQVQLEEYKEETRQIAAALKKAEDLLETERICWQREKIPLMEEMEKSTALYETQLDEQKCEKKALAAALRTVEQKLEGHQVEWQQEKTSLIQATEDLKKTLQEKEQEWEEKDSSMRSQLEDLLSKKKNKKKWYRWFLRLARSTHRNCD